MFSPAYLEKIVTAEVVRERFSPAARGQGRLVFTNGCFDLIHTGHTRYLAQAAGLGQALVVGLNSDRSVRAIKGPPRPLRPQDKRAEVLAALACVDYVVVFDEDTPARLIAALEPDVLVKGGDWPVEMIVGAEGVFRRGGRVLSLPLIEGESTSGLIELIKRV